MRFISPLVPKTELENGVSVIMSFELLKYSLKKEITLHDPNGVPIEIPARNLFCNKRLWARGEKTLKIP